MSYKVKMDNVANVLKGIRLMAKQRVLVGIPASENSRDDQIGNAQLGYIHENGSPANNIPARPWLRPGVESALPACINVLKEAAKESFRNPRAVEQGLNRAGLAAVSAVKKYIRDSGNFVPLMHGTIKARKRKGFQGEKPLIRTGQMLNSVTYVIRNK